MTRNGDNETLGEDSLDLGIRAAFGDGDDGDTRHLPGTRSVIQSFRYSHHVRQITLREIAEEPGSVVKPASGQKGETPRRIDRYQIAGELARGGVGSVLKARDVDLGRDVALKILLDSHRGNPEITRRFFEEAQIGGQLEHPGIVPVHEIGLLADDRPFFTMKLVKGQTLAELLQSRADLDEGRQRFLGIFEQVCQTLAYAHTKGVMHRDVKASNVMVGAFGEVQVMDWGLAKVLRKGGVADERRTTVTMSAEETPGGGERTEEAAPPADSVKTVRSEDQGSASVAGCVMGTPAYMAPEQARGAVNDLDERSDVFGLGAMLCEILTGKPPYTGSSTDEVYRKARQGDLEQALDRLERCGADGILVDLVKDCLASQPRERPRSAVVVAKRIRSYLESLESRARTLELRATRTRFKLALALTILVGLVVGGGGYLVVDSERREQRDRTRETVRETLNHGRDLWNRARSEEDPSLWESARREYERALNLAKNAGDDLLLERARLRLELLRREVDNRRVVTDLEALRADSDSGLEEIDEAFRKVFSDYGIQVENVAPEVAARQIQDSDIRAHLVHALDQWAVMRRRMWRSSWKQLFRIAQLADDDEWRRKLRRAVEEKDLDTLEVLSREFMARKANPSTLELLASSIKDNRNDALALEVWRQSQELHPGDFWINVRLGEELLRQGELDEALQYVRAAVAIRPGSGYGRHVLASALAERGEVSSAIREYGKAILEEPRLQRGRVYFACAALLEDAGDTIPAADLDNLASILEGVLRSDREHHYDGAVALLSRALFLRGDRAKAIWTLEEAVRVTGSQPFGFHRGRGPGGRGPGARSPGVRSPRGKPMERMGGGGNSAGRFRGGRFLFHHVQLDEFRAAVLPDLVSYASIDWALGVDASATDPLMKVKEFRALHASSADESARLRLDFLEARLLQREKRHDEAADKFSGVVARDRSVPEPFLGLAECLRASGRSSEAEEVLSGALHLAHLQGNEMLWRLWGELSLADLRRSPAEILGVFPPLATMQPIWRGRFAIVRNRGEDLRWALERLAAGEPIRINSGGENYTATDGTIWGRDRFYTRGSFPGFPGAGPIAGTGDHPLYRTERWFGRRPGPQRPQGYEVPLPPGRYEVTLHFAEVYLRARDADSDFRRVFDVLVEGKSVRESYEPAKRGFATADRWTVTAEVSDGILEIHFGHRRENPKVSAVEIRRAD